MTRPAEAERGRIAPARAAAYQVLRAVSSGKADLPHALARARARLPDERDRALAGEVATGTLRWQAAFDRIVQEFSGRPLTKLDPEVLDVLRSAIFQLLHLDRVPTSAVVSDAVDLTKKIGKRSAAPLVNAVLRRTSRERDHLPLPPRPDTAANREAQLDYLAITLSHPRWLAVRWLDRFGFEDTEAWMRFDNSPAPLTLRTNRLRTTTADLVQALAAHGVRTKPGKHGEDALIVTEGNPLLTPVANEGLFVVQDEASQLVAQLVAACPGERVLDACASPGGKTTAIAARMGDRGLIVATDVRRRRVDLLARTVRSSGASSIRIVRADASGLPFAELSARFDWILLDVPCSGLGTIRRDPDVRWRRQEADLPRFAESQLRMLTETSRLVRPGGHLVYATCSSEPDENEEVVGQFIDDGRFGLAAPAVSRVLTTPDGYLRTYPFRHGLEAFFGAVLVKAG
jgi:16S rRNA (cytosine967-C5)-methyltransferase